MNDEALKSKLLAELSLHVGKDKAIGMGELFERVFDRPYRSRINDTRPIRTLIDELQKEGVPVCSSQRGYYLASAHSELAAYCKNLRAQGLRKLKKEANLRKMTLPELLGQLSLELRE